MMYSCPCNAPKVTLVTLDGGTTGEFAVALCKKCRNQENFKFLIKEVHIDVE